MVVIEETAKVDNPYNPPSNATNTAHSTRSSSDPPPFEATSSTALLLEGEEANWPQYGEEQPPEFTPYAAEHFVTSSGDVISHDPHLNEDGEALYRFLLSQASEPPSFVLRCSGTHTETRTRLVTHSGHIGSGNNNGHHHGPHTKTETYTEKIVDFDFRIDLTHLLLAPVHWSVNDSEPAYRGNMVREVEVQDGISLKRKAAKRKQKKEAERWRKYRTKTGLPPWVQAGETAEAAAIIPTNIINRSSRSFRDWADDYCGSKKQLKEFVYEKVVHGWDIGALEKAIELLIRSTHYNGHTSVSFNVTKNKIYIRPTNSLSRLLSTWWIVVILWIFLIYPFIWLYKRFHPEGGGIWRVVGGAYSTKQWIHLPDSFVGEDVAQYLIRKQDTQTRPAPSYTPDYKPAVPTLSRTPSDPWATHQRTPSGAVVVHQGTSKLQKLRQTPKGISELTGVREGEWFREWEGTLRRAVLLRLQRDEPMYQPDEVVAENAGAGLDGFYD